MGNKPKWDAGPSWHGFVFLGLEGYICAWIMDPQVRWWEISGACSLTTCLIYLSLSHLLRKEPGCGCRSEQCWQSLMWTSTKPGLPFSGLTGSPWSSRTKPLSWRLVRTFQFLSIFLAAVPLQNCSPVSCKRSYAVREQRLKTVGPQAKSGPGQVLSDLHSVVVGAFN